MSLFKNVFGNSGQEETSSKVAWRQLTDLGELNVMVSESAEKPVLLFKHSTRCAISRMVLKQFDPEYQPKHKDLYRVSKRCSTQGRCPIAACCKGQPAKCVHSMWPTGRCGRNAHGNRAALQACFARLSESFARASAVVYLRHASRL